MMVEFMDKSGRIYRATCEQFSPSGEDAYSNCAHDAGEVLIGLLKQVPQSKFLRGPYLSPEPKEKPNAKKTRD